MMRDPITDASQDPSCLLCLTPDRGGSWWSRLRPHTPRNFAENPMTWTDAKTELDTIDQSHDFTFEIEFKCVKTNAVYVFASDGLRDFIRIFMSNGTVIVNTALLGTSSGGSTQFSAGSDSTNRHVLTVKITGNSITALVDGEIIYTRENLVRNVIEIGTPRSNAGYVYKISVTDDTTGGTIWQAAYSDLYDTSNPWPSATPINFSTQSYTWDSFNAIQNTVDFSHDFTFEIEFECTVQTNARIFYVSSTGSLFGIYHFSTGLVIFTTSLLGNTDTGRMYTEFTLHPAGTYLTRRHIAKMIVAGNTATAYLDDVVIGSANAAYVKRVTPSNLSAPASTGGYIYSMRLTDDTTGETVFSYPSEAERVQLLTKTNVRTDRGVFEAADTSKRWSVTTQLSASLLIPACTIVVYLNNPDGELTSYVSCAQFLNPSQGFFVIRRQNSSQLYIGYSGRDGSGGNFYPGYYVSSPDSECTVALVIDYTSMKICCYINGIEVDNRTMHTTIVAPPEFDETAKPVILGVTSGSDGLNSTTKISRCLIFDRALSAAEIAALTPKQSYLWRNQ